MWAASHARTNHGISADELLSSVLIHTHGSHSFITLQYRIFVTLARENRAFVAEECSIYAVCIFISSVFRCAHRWFKVVLWIWFLCTGSATAHSIRHVDDAYTILWTTIQPLFVLTWWNWKIKNKTKNRTYLKMQSNFRFALETWYSNELKDVFRNCRSKHPNHVGKYTSHIFTW